MSISMIEVTVDTFKLRLKEGEFDAIGALFRKGRNLETPAKFNFLDNRSGLHATSLASPASEQFKEARHLFVAAIDNIDVLNYARDALNTAKEAGALCLLVVPLGEANPQKSETILCASKVGSETDCVIYAPGLDATTALMAVITRSCAGIADQYAIAVDYNDLRAVLSRGRTGVFVTARGPDPVNAHSRIVDESNKALNLFSGVTTQDIKGDVLCICLNNNDHRIAIGVIGPHQKIMMGSRASVLYNPGYWPNYPSDGTEDNFVSRIFTW